MNRRGVTLMEALATMAVGAIGISGVLAMYLSSASVVRRTNSQGQALALAQRELELIVARGCDVTAVPVTCDNLIAAFDGQVRQVWLSTTSGIVTNPPALGDPTRREYRVAIDIDGAANGREGIEVGSPALNRGLENLVFGAGATRGVLVNARVTVSWEQPLGTRQVVAVQTRIAP